MYFLLLPHTQQSSSIPSNFVLERASPIFVRSGSISECRTHKYHEIAWHFEANPMEPVPGCETQISRNKKLQLVNRFSICLGILYFLFFAILFFLCWLHIVLSYVCFISFLVVGDSTRNKYLLRYERPDTCIIYICIYIYIYGSVRKCACWKQ